MGGRLEGFAVAFWCIADVIVSSLAVMEVRSRLLSLAFLLSFGIIVRSTIIIFFIF